jgi:hypothetical protein
VQAVNKTNYEKSEESHNFFEKGSTLQVDTEAITLDDGRFSDNKLLGLTSGCLSWIKTKFL